MKSLIRFDPCFQTNQSDALLNQLVNKIIRSPVLFQFHKNKFFAQSPCEYSSPRSVCCRRHPGRQRLLHLHSDHDHRGAGTEQSAVDPRWSTIEMSPLTTCHSEKHSRGRDFYFYFFSIIMGHSESVHLTDIMVNSTAFSHIAISALMMIM